MPNTREKLIELQKAAIREFMSSTTDVPLTDFTADYLIANGVTINRVTEDTPVADNLSPTGWIPVSERLPEDDGKYLVFEQSGGRTNTSILRFAKDARKVDRYDFKGRWKNAWYEYDSEWGHYTVNSVTHWMPLPQPPKGE